MVHSSYPLRRYHNSQNCRIPVSRNAESQLPEIQNPVYAEMHIPIFTVSRTDNDVNILYYSACGRKETTGDENSIRSLLNTHA